MKWEATETRNISFFLIVLLNDEEPSKDSIVYKYPTAIF
jgi:hypothetical protein